jgi:hypothetical protein
MLLSALNFFPIPYYVVSMSSYNIFLSQRTRFLRHRCGVRVYPCFYFYITFFQKIEDKADYLLRNMNTIIGSITVVSIITLFNIIRYYKLVCHISTNQTPIFYNKTMANENFFERVCCRKRFLMKSHILWRYCKALGTARSARMVGQ